jgi:hypothetical protein
MDRVVTRLDMHEKPKGNQRTTMDSTAGNSFHDPTRSIININFDPVSKSTT